MQVCKTDKVYLHGILPSDRVMITSRFKRNTQITAVDTMASNQDLFPAVALEPQHYCQPYQDISAEYSAPQSDCAVYIRDLCKKYGSGPKILENFYMTVRKKTIYGLLGSSGSGKSTALSCIVGLSKWDSGDVQVLGKTPGSKESDISGKKLGYMPQDIALYGQLTITENVQFYCRTYRITGKFASERWAFLKKLLELPTDDKYAANLSGGQKRRVSLALALIHSPELLILDEPTVGLDPLLRQRIWGLLCNLVSSLGTTIIITTHYIDEARNSNIVGVLRKGRLLVENTPNNILEQFQCHLLEYAVLKLCREDENSRMSNRHSVYPVAAVSAQSHSFHVSFNANNTGTSPVHHELAADDKEIRKYLGQSIDANIESATNIYKIKNTKLFNSLLPVYGSMTVILQNYSRYPPILAAILLLPTLQGFLFGWIIGSIPKGLHFGVVNNEISNWTDECSLPVHITNSCHLEMLSCKLLNQLEKDTLMILDPFETEEDAIANANLGKIWGYIIFPFNYTEHALELAITKHFAMNESIQRSRVIAHLDNSQYITTMFMIKHLFSSFEKYGHHLANACGGIGERAETSPVLFRKAVYGKDEGGNYMDFQMPGCLFSSFMTFPFTFTALLLIADKNQGTLGRARVAGLTPLNIVISHLVIQIAFGIVEWILFCTVMYFCFGWLIQGSLWLCLAFSILTVVCSTQLGVLIGILLQNEVEAILLGLFLVGIVTLYGGNIWPAEGMAKIAQYLGRIFPVLSPTESLRSITVRGVAFLHPLVWPGFVEVAVWTVIFSIMCCLAVKFKIKRI